jgi:signal peptidase I
MGRPVITGRPAPRLAMQSRRITKLLPIGLGLIVLGSAWFYFAPTGLGGSTTYVVTDGISMEPHFHGGDLAAVRRQSSYHVGEIVAYNSNVFHTIVLHRIIALDGDRYVFKGDNNNFTDFEHPAKSQLIGALWLHVPGAGAELQSMRSPALVGGLIAAGILLFAGAAFTHRRRRRGKERRSGQALKRRPQRSPAPTRASSPDGVARPVSGVLIVGAVALFPFLALALLAFTRPSTVTVPSKVPYEQSGHFSYTANATPGPAYPGNRAVTGDPLFTHVLNSASVQFTYRFHSRAPHSISGRASLAASITSTSGWQRTLALGHVTYFRGNRAQVAATIGLSGLVALLHRVENVTAAGGSYTLALIPHVHVNGSVAGLALHTTYEPSLRFSLNQLELQPKSASGTLLQSNAASVGPFVQSASGVVAGTRSQPRFLNFGIAHISVANARVISLVAIVTIICTMLAALALIRPRRREESAAIRARYKRMIVPVERVWQLPGVAVIDVGDMDALARIAEHYDRSILHERTEQGDAFWVTDESGQFRYSLESSASSRGPSYVAEHPLDLLVSDEYAGEPLPADAVAAPPESTSTDELPVAQADAPVADLAAQDAADAAMRETNDWNAAWEAAGSEHRGGTGFGSQPQPRL